MKTIHKKDDPKAKLYGENESIKFSIILNIAFKNMFYKKLRTTLTVIGVIVGLGSVVFLLAFGYGLRNLVTSQVVDSKSIRTIDVNQPNAKILKFNTETEQDMEAFNGVESVSRIFNFASTVDYEGSNTGTVLYGVDQQYIDLNSFELIAGPNMKIEDKGSVIVNTSFLEALGVKNEQEVLNKNINVVVEVPEIEQVDGIEPTIKLNLKVHSVISSGTGSEIYMTSEVFKERRLDNANQAKVLVVSKEDVPNLQKRIASLGYVTSSPLDTVEQIDQVFSILNLIFLGFGSIGLVIAVLGMFNTLTITLLERTKEIGLLRSLGARKKDIRRLFIIESIGLSVLGGALGILTAFIFGSFVNRFLNSIANSRGLGESISVFSFSMSLMMQILVFSAVLGLMVVYIPARRASHMSPIDALRG